MAVLYLDRITREMIRQHPNNLYVFGDNFQRMGRGGQAKEMRGEPNAVGIPTKRMPTMHPVAFLQDNDLKEWEAMSESVWKRLFEHTGTIVWPKADIGTGLAELPKRAPLIYQKITHNRKILELL